MKTTPAIMAAIILFFCGTDKVVADEESVEYMAEHVLETPMNARALEFPVVPYNVKSARYSVQSGGGQYSAGNLAATEKMFAISYFKPINSSWGLNLSGYFDSIKLSGNKGPALGQILTVQAPELPVNFNIEIQNVDGRGSYSGLTMAISNYSNESWRWQAGMGASRFKVDKFDVKFDTVDFSSNFTANFDYAATYNLGSLFFSAEKSPFKLSDNFIATPHAIAVFTFPRVGFKGGVSGPGFNYSGDTNETGNGRHIPDSVIGIGFILEHLPSGIAVDIGASLFTYLMEPVYHKGIEKPLFLNIHLSLPLN